MSVLVVGVVLVGVALLVIVLAAVVGASKPTGVARSLELLNQRPTGRDVSKRELSVQDRILGPMLDGLGAAAQQNCNRDGGEDPRGAHGNSFGHY